MDPPRDRRQRPLAEDHLDFSHRGGDALKRAQIPLHQVHLRALQVVTMPGAEVVEHPEVVALA